MSFDPRLQPGEITDREAEFKQAGYHGQFVRDANYQGMLGLLTMTRDWIDP